MPVLANQYITAYAVVYSWEEEYDGHLPSEGSCGDAHILAVQTLRLKDLVVCLLG